MNLLSWIGAATLAFLGVVFGWLLGNLILILRDYDEIDWGDDEF
jgi:hypothetical protein